MEYKKVKGVPIGMEKDPDYYNQKLWKRKLLKKRRERNEIKKMRKGYFKEKESVGEKGIISTTDKSAEAI